MDHPTELKDIIHNDEETIVLSETQALCRTSRTCTVPERDRFLTSEQRDVLLIEDNEPITYEESMNSSESDKWLRDGLHVYKPSMEFG